MDSEENSGRSHGASLGPLRIFKDSDGKLYVTGFGLWSSVKTGQEGLELIAELENQGYRMCT